MPRDPRDLSDLAVDTLSVHLGRDESDPTGAIVSEQFEFSPTADCTWCEFKKICPRHHLKDVPL